MTIGDAITYFIYFPSDSYDNLACPLYDDTKNEDGQVCTFSILNQGGDLNDEEFQQFWSHVEDEHGNTYVQILDMCQLKTSIECEPNRMSH